MPSRSFSHFNVESVAAASRSPKISLTGRADFSPAINTGSTASVRISNCGVMGSNCPFGVTLFTSAWSSGDTEPLQSANEMVRGGGPADNPALGADHFQGGLLELWEVTFGAIFKEDAVVSPVV